MSGDLSEQKSIALLQESCLEEEAMIERLGNYFKA